jgi:hypothetical protein
MKLLNMRCSIMTRATPAAEAEVQVGECLKLNIGVEHVAVWKSKQHNHLHLA